MYIRVKTFFRKYSFEIITTIIVAFVLSIVQLHVSRPIILAERFVRGGGWIEIFILLLYTVFITNKLKNPLLAPIWRIRIWFLFALVFFAQLIIGLLGVEKFLMTGKLHFPIPAIIVLGPIYRGELTFMIIFFFSTIILTGPSWCSHLCYFGAFDGISSRGKTPIKPFKGKWSYKLFSFILIIGSAIFFRLFGVNYIIASIGAIIIGIVGILVIIFVTRKQNRMVHCFVFCPIGTIVSFTKFASPFRMKINTDCSMCFKCISSCKYDALSIDDIKNYKPGLTCTYCGDCVKSCHSSSIRYSLFQFSADKSRAVFLSVSIILHVACMAFARI